MTRIAQGSMEGLRCAAAPLTGCNHQNGVRFDLDYLSTQRAPTPRTPSPSIERSHDIVPAHVRREVALHTLLPVRHLERRRVAPRLERELLLDDAREVLRPALARELGRGRLDQPRVYQICASVGVVSR